ncbi:MAG: hypothetical protein KAT77_02225 [Nanoarchaeota archaeon]|nr:hypothetical protein [Nanoarchaeota archaeon]
MENQESQKRQIAHKIQIKDILQGTYHQQEGWNPNYLLTQNNQKVSRVNLIATLISQTQEQSTNLLLDDGTGQITARIFEPLKTPLPEIGDIILVIAKIREFNQEKYLMPEIIKKIKNPKWIQVRKIEFQKSQPQQAKVTEEKIEPQSESDEGLEKSKTSPEETPLAPYENLLNLIKKLDQGEGVNVDDLIKQSTLPNCEELVESLLKEGEIFEITPGKIKILK